MRCGYRLGGLAVTLLAVFALSSGGCSQAGNPGGRVTDKVTGTEKSSDVADAKSAHDHSGWWCDEHGIPEAECSMCSPKAAAAFKKKGDWCEKHDRARSQCFICDASLKDKYAARYRAKYGKEPPEPTDNQAPKGADKKEG